MSRISKKITIGGGDHVKAVTLGGDSPVVIQTMWKDRLFFEDLDNAVTRIDGLAKMGCGLVRCAVPDLSAAEVVGRLAQMTSMPLVADIHFDHTIALRCMDFPIAKIRINPGNIGGKEKVRAVLEKAGERGVAIRIGVNAGSLPKDLRIVSRRGAENAEEGRGFVNGAKPSESPFIQNQENMEEGAEFPNYAQSSAPSAPSRLCVNSSEYNALVEAAERELAIFDEFGFSNVIVSMKASKIADTIMSNRIFARKYDVPLHIGVTEAGPLIAGAVRSSAALAMLLAEGIGDTLRVSLSDSMENEVIAAREICTAAAEMAAISSGGGEAAARLSRNGVTIISCPRCARAGFDTHGFTSRWLPRLYGMDKRLTIAIMGCEVNGPEEARHADLGITGTGSKVLLFRRGEAVRTVSAEEADAAFGEELEKLENMH